MKKNICNVEHLEASVIDNAKKVEEITDKMGPEDRKKMEAVQNAIKLLNNNNVPFFLFPYINNPEYNNKPIAWKFDSLFKHLKFDKSGNLTEEDKKLLSDITSSFIYSVIVTFFGPILSNPKEVMEHIKSYIVYEDFRLYGNRKDNK